ncbi:MAG: YkgJ family cysteine cluster protein [Proteobacteria bacterium]|nr:YkgJ family cysteine cluster protein [Pseudomonadota bacterium]
MKIIPEQDAVKSAAISIARNIIETDHSDNFLLNMMRHLIAFGDTLISKTEAIDSNTPIACSCGCSYCCHMQVKVTPPEIFLIFAYILKTFNIGEQDRLNKRILSNRLLTEGKTLDERILLKRETPCIFLTDHSCDIYKARPLICHAWHSLNRDGCESAFISEDAHAEIETAPLRNYVLSMIREAIKDICINMNWEYDAYELPSAIFSCFHDENPMKNWLLKHHLFNKDVYAGNDSEKLS